MQRRYNPKEIEPKWQKVWEEQETYKADLKSSKPKYIAMSMFNYPSGAGIHIGHAMNYTISDIMARVKRQQGFESYHPVGWDSFGLPAENYAIKSGVSPQASMAKIIPHYHKQYKAMGWSNDWSKEISTHLPEYYKWSQWIFSQMYRNGLAYQDSRMQWWCEKCQTVLANEQVEANGKCWRHDGPSDPVVTKKEVKQWFFKITDYADELLEATDELDWTEGVKLAQKNWIGKSVGAEIGFTVDGSDDKVTVFTTRPDTLFGTTFLVLAPEHKLVLQVTTKEKMKEVETYQSEVIKKTEVERQAAKEKSGVFTGSYAINPISNEKIPIWTADYVLMNYGTGAIMAVPGHDERDQEFAKKFNLPIKNVIEPTFGLPQGDEIHKVGVNVIVRNPQTDEVLVLDWGPRQERFGGNMLIGGGVEEGEDIVECAKREIEEETGYTDVELVARSEAVGHGYFYSNVKNQNFSIDAHGLYFELKSDKKNKINLDEGEKQKFSVRWVPKEKVAPLLHDGIHRYFFETLALGKSYDGEGVLVNSSRLDGISTSEARENIIVDLASKGSAKEKVNYKMRDWSISRQRYWGAPIPIIHCQDCGTILIEDEDLPVILPELEDFQPSGDGRSALARATDWLNVKCPKCGGAAERETDTLDTYICSSWYMLRYFDPKNADKIFDSQVVDKWLSIDFYNGADHATAHMIYARFITRFFNKIGLVEHKEPFKRFLFNGKVTAQDGSNFSKSKGNGVDPLEIIESGYGADALRTYLMFAAPLEQWVRWDPQGVPGTYRFLTRLWNITHEYLENDKHPGESKAILGLANRTIKKVTDDLEHQKYNTAIAAMMKFTNDLYNEKSKNGFTGSDSWQFALESLVQLVAPFAPHIADELWHNLGHEDTVHSDHWPEMDKSYLLDESFTLVIQVNGKRRAETKLPTGVNEDAVLKAAQEAAASYLEGKELKHHIYVPGRIINLII